MTGNKFLKKMMCAALAGASVFTSVAMFSACTTSHPKVEMKLSFNNETYTLEYKLYRKTAPATVQHFLELAAKGYYDGLCIHDYQSGSKLTTGGYTQGTNENENGGLVEKPYFETVKDWNLTQTTWHDEGRKQPADTVYGEFSDNGFKVENNPLKETYGSLTMYYTPKSKCPDQVYVKRADGDGYDPRPYKYNSATSLFYISLSPNTKTNTQYCTFATLDGDSEETLKDLEEAIAKYIKDEYADEADKFVTEVSMTVDEDDPYMSAAKEKATYQVPTSSIIVKSVKVKSY